MRSWRRLGSPSRKKNSPDSSLFWIRVSQSEISRSGRRSSASGSTPNTASIATRLAGGQRQVEADEAIDGPDERDDAHEPQTPHVDAPHARDVQRVMEHVEGRDEILGREGPDPAPFAAAELGAGRRIDEELVEPGSKTRPVAASTCGSTQKGKRLALLKHERDIGHDNSRIARFDLKRKFERGPRGPLACWKFG